MLILIKYVNDQSIVVVMNFRGIYRVFSKNPLLFSDFMIQYI